jgi:hypothetical protein
MASAPPGSRRWWNRSAIDRLRVDVVTNETGGFVPLQLAIALLYRRFINAETGMTFKEAVGAYIKAAQSHGPTSDAKPSPSQSNETHGTWYLRDRKGNQVARVSRSGVRFAGSNELAHKKKGARRARARR